MVLQMDFSQFFREKYTVRCVVEAHESWTPCFFVSIPTIKYYRTLMIGLHGTKVEILTFEPNIVFTHKSFRN